MRFTDGATIIALIRAARANSFQPSTNLQSALALIATRRFSGLYHLWPFRRRLLTRTLFIFYLAEILLQYHRGKVHDLKRIALRHKIEHRAVTQGAERV
jgi:hypothetical protein